MRRTDFFWFEDADIESYTALRNRVYGRLREEGVLTWDWMDGREYALADAAHLSRAQIGELRTAAERLGRVYARVVDVVCRADDELLAMLGLPEATWPAVRADGPWPWPTLIGRFDFALTQEGVKMLEFNSDTPTAVVEAFCASGAVCREYGLRDPNAGCEQHLAEGFRAAVDILRRKGFAVDRIVFSALGWHEEDAGTTRYLLAKSCLAGRFVPLADLRVDGERLLAPAEGGGWEAVDLWFRLHPLEKLAGDRDEDGYPTGARVLELAASGRLAMLNPPRAFVAQSKAVQALIWRLYESGEFLTGEEREAVGRWMLPTYLENRFAGVKPYVQKPVYGREGGSVVLFDASGREELRGATDEYADQRVVYQERVTLPVVSVMTLDGFVCGTLVLGVFLIAGRASAVVARVGGDVTDNSACFCPVGFRSEGR